jgi:hypothetical protein
MLNCQVNTAGEMEILAQPPRTFDPSWGRDGITEEPGTSKVWGKRAWWLYQILKYVPVTHWEQRFRATPIELIRAVVEHNGEWNDHVLGGWAQSVKHFKESRWAAPLWICAFDSQVKKTGGDAYIGSTRRLSLLLLSPAEIEQLVIPRLAGLPIGDRRWDVTISSFWDEEWSDALGMYFLDAIRDRRQDGETHRNERDLWFEVMPITALHLPPSCLARAWDEWSSYESSDRSYWHQCVRKFLDNIQIRLRIIKEIPI